MKILRKFISEFLEWFVLPLLLLLPLTGIIILIIVNLSRISATYVLIIVFAAIVAYSAVFFFLFARLPHYRSKFTHAGVIAVFALLIIICTIYPSFLHKSPTLPPNSPPIRSTLAPTPVASLVSVLVKSEVQPDGTVKNTSTLSLNSLGVGELLLTYPKEMDLQNTDLVRLSITPDGALINLLSVAVPTQNPSLPAPLKFTDRIDIYPIMQANLSGVGFEITPDEQPRKAILSDRPTEWTWSLKPKQEGLHLIVVRVSIPVIVDSEEETIETTLKNIPAEIKVTKPWQSQFVDLLPIIIPAVVGLISIVVKEFADNQAKERGKKIKDLERQIAQSASEREALEKEIARLKAIPEWQFWRR